MAESEKSKGGLSSLFSGKHKYLKIMAAGFGIAILLLIFVIFPSRSPANNALITYSCTGQSQAGSNGYGLYGECTFSNSGGVAGQSCATINLRENGAIVNQQTVCAEVPAHDAFKKDFFIGMALTKTYTWDY